MFTIDLKVANCLFSVCKAAVDSNKKLTFLGEFGFFNSILRWKVVICCCNIVGAEELFVGTVELFEEFELFVGVVELFEEVEVEVTFGGVAEVVGVVFEVMDVTFRFVVVDVFDIWVGESVVFVFVFDGELFVDSIPFDGELLLLWVVFTEFKTLLLFALFTAFEGDSFVSLLTITFSLELTVVGVVLLEEPLKTFWVVDVELCCWIVTLSISHNGITIKCCK